MKLYNPASKEVTTFANLKFKYNIQTPDEAIDIGFHKLIDKIDDYIDYDVITTNFVAGQIVETNEGYVRLIRPSTDIQVALTNIEETKTKLRHISDWIKSQISVWDGSLTYTSGDYVLKDDSVWLATDTSLNNSPDQNDPEAWQQVII